MWPVPARVILIVVAFAFACSGGSAPAAAPNVGRAQSQHALPIADLPAEFRGQTPALAETAILELLPDSIMALAVARSPLQLASATDVLEVLREYKEFFADTNVALSTDGAARLLAPTTWSHLGIDASAPIGAGVTVEKRLVGFFLVTLSDAEKFTQSLPDVANAVGLGEVLLSARGNARIAHFSKAMGVAVVVHAKAAILVLCDRRSDLGAALDTLVGASDTIDLATSGRIAKHFSEFSYGEDIAGFVAFDTIMAKLLERENRRHSGDSYWAQQVEEIETKLEEAKSSGSGEEDIQRLEGALRSALDEYNRSAVREAAERHFTKDVVAPLGTVAFGVDLDGPRTGLRLRFQPTPGSIASRLLASGAGPLQLPTRLRESPLWMLAANVDKKAAVELLTALFGMDGVTKSSFGRDLKRTTNVDLEEFLRIVGGEVSGAFTVDTETLSSATSTEEAANAFGVHVLVEFRDPAAARVLLNRAAQSGLQQYRVGEGDNLALELPSWSSRPIRIELNGRYLEARSVGEGATTEIWHDHETALVHSANAMAVALFDPMFIQWMLAADYAGHMHYLEGPAAPKTPKEQARLVELATKIEALTKQRDAARAAQSLESRVEFGRITVIAQREDKERIALIGALVGSATHLARGMQAIAEVLEPALVHARTGNNSELQNLTKEIQKLRSEQWELRSSR